MKNKKNEKKKKWKLKKSTILISVILLLATSIIGITYGKYVYLGIRNYYLESKSFYFNSDKLTETGSTYRLNNWSGVEAFNVTFNMNSYKNNIVFAEYDIDYTISFSCSDNLTCSSTKTSDTIPSAGHISSFTISMSPNGTLSQGDVVWLEVTTSATSPYTKTLTGRVELEIGEERLTYEIEDSSNRTYMDLSITNTREYYTLIDPESNPVLDTSLEISEYTALSDTNQDKYASALITLSFDPNVVILDMTTPAYGEAISESYTSIDGKEYLSSITFKMEALSSVSVRFYKKVVSNDYTYPFTNDTSIVTVSY